jgi:hypothetical protein
VWRGEQFEELEQGPAAGMPAGDIPRARIADAAARNMPPVPIAGSGTLACSRTPSIAAMTSAAAAGV